MLDTTIELISLAASNSLAVFCFCNLIIAVLLVGSSKPPSPQFDQVVKPINAFPINNDDFKKNRVSSSSPEKAKDDLVHIEEEEEEEEEKVSSAVSIDMVENGDETPDQEEQEEEEEDNDDHDDDELRKRVEEFIEKTNRGWRAEKMRTYIL